MNRPAPPPSVPGARDVVRIPATAGNSIGMSKASVCAGYTIQYHPARANARFRSDFEQTNLSDSHIVAEWETPRAAAVAFCVSGSVVKG